MAIARQMPDVFDEYHVVDGRIVKLEVAVDWVTSREPYPREYIQDWHGTVAQARADTEAANEARTDAQFNRATGNSSLYG